MFFIEYIGRVGYSWYEDICGYGCRYSLSRRLKRDITNRGRNIQDVLEQYKNHVKPAFDYYIAPTMIHADLIVPRGGENEVAIKLIVQHVQVKI